MSQYATSAEWIAAGPSGLISPMSNAEKEAYLEKASGIIEDAIRDRYAIPVVDPIPESLKIHTMSVATYNLLSAVGYNPNEFDENYRLRYEDATRWMRDVATKKLSLPAVLKDSPGVDTGAGIYTQPSRGW